VRYGEHLWLPDRKPVPAERPTDYLDAPGSYMQGLSGLVHNGRLHVYGDFGGGPQSGPLAPNHGEAHWMIRYPSAADPAWERPEWRYLWRGHGGGEGPISETYAPSIVLAPWGEWLDAYSGSMRIVPPEHAMTSRVAVGIATAPTLLGPWTPHPYVAAGVHPDPKDPTKRNSGGVWAVALLVVGERVLLLGRDSTRITHSDADGYLDTHVVWEIASDLSAREVGTLRMDPVGDRSTWGNDAAIDADGRLVLLDSCQPGAAHKFRSVVEWATDGPWTGDGRAVLRRTGRTITHPAGDLCWDGGYTRDERGNLVADGPLFANVATENNPWSRGVWRCQWQADGAYADALAVVPLAPVIGPPRGTVAVWGGHRDLCLDLVALGPTTVEWEGKVHRLDPRPMAHAGDVRFVRPSELWQGYLDEEYRAQVERGERVALVTVRGEWWGHARIDAPGGGVVYPQALSGRWQ